MRNWNHSQTKWMAHKQACFYSTYEELKQANELNQFCTSSKFLQYLWGIETLWVHFLRQRQLNVFTVPMRNWNLYHVKFILSILYVLQYLWGIETQLRNCQMLLLERFYSTYEELKPYWHLIKSSIN